MEEQIRLNQFPPGAASADDVVSDSLESRAARMGVIPFKDPNLVALLRAAQREKRWLYVIILSLLGLNIYLFARRPTILTAVVTESGRRVVTINDRDYGNTEAVQLGPDHLTNADKQYLVSECARSLYAIDQASRGKDIERALKMMTDDFAVRYANWLKSKGELEQQRSEKWQAVWTEQENKIDPNDPYTVHLIGEQLITKEVGNQVKQVKRVTALDFKLIADLPRSDRNIRTGFLVAFFGGNVISETPVETSQAQ